jgi:hypothetical protein
MRNLRRLRGVHRVGLEHQQRDGRRAGSPDLSGVRIGGHSYDVWLYPHPNHVGDTVTFLAQNPVTSLSAADVSSFTQYAEDKGWADPSWYLTSVGAGFEIWQDGAGLGVNSFDVSGPASS